MITSLYFIFGLIFGSFANVVIHRLPEGMSLVSPPSRCPVCGTQIKWMDNIPILSWVVLRGKCRACGNPISIRYPLVELVSGVLFVSAWLYHENHLQAIILILFFYYLMLISFIDLERYIIPNKLTYPFLILSLLLLAGSALTGVKIIPVPETQSVVSGLTAAAASFGFFLLLDLAGRFIYKKESIGAGDMKLAVITGLYLGWIAFVAYMIAIMFAAVAGIIASSIKQANYLPLGPFISLAAVVSVFYGEKILYWYTSLII